MRALLTLLALAVIVVAGLLYFGIISLSASGGEVRAPTVRADVGSVSMGTENRTVTVPTINVERAGEAPANAQ
jgi:hypothetical protein